MRTLFAIIFILLVIALSVCTVVSKRSHKAIGTSVAILTFSLIFPVIGHLIIISSVMQLPATIGYYIYFLGMDFVVVSLLHFAFVYCVLTWPSPKHRVIVFGLVGADVLQYILNPFTGQAFTTEEIVVEGEPYFRLVPYLGQTLHRVLCYGILVAVILVFVYKSARASSVNRERYTVILFTLIVFSIWQTFFIFSRTPIDRSMVGFGVFGILIFYFSLYYRPMRLLDQMLAGIASDLPEALFFFDGSGRCIWANAPALALTGTDEKNFEQIQLRLAELFGDYEQDANTWSSRKTIGPEDDLKYYELEKRTLKDDRGRIAGSFLSVRDTTLDQQHFEQELYGSMHDSLTGLDSKELLYQKISELLRKKPNAEYMIVYVDVKNFKIVNDVFGYAFGDHALRCIADWVKVGLSESAICGRLGGDTFGACLPVDEFDPHRIEQALADFVVRKNNVSHNILIHLGVYVIAEKNLDVDVMFDRAHLALSSIKDDYQKHIAYYDDTMRNKVLWDQKISADLRGALEKKQIVPYLQPIVDPSGTVVGAEALIRWNHPEHGFLNPNSFIPVFEKNGMISEIDRYMWRCACELLSRWKDHPIFLSVNISPRDFYFMDVPAELKALVAEYGVEPARLRIEITESAMMTDVEKRMGIFHDLKHAGFIVEMDDFGSGYSSLNMLKDMPVDFLKIDMNFLSKSQNEYKAKTIVRNIIQLSEELGIGSLTEGVETPSQYHVLSDMGCKLFQGYYFAKPMTVEDFEVYVFSKRSA
ncbi:MAG: EAL domain-containing protein [Lachnospiraceae bacterium]|nr:EAL domain-containing protein [Lachnospiraceae bacterium]